MSWRIKLATLSRVSHAAWMPTTESERYVLRRHSKDPDLWKIVRTMVNECGCVEAWHSPSAVREVERLSDEHAEEVVDIYDIPDMEEFKFSLMSDMMRSHIGESYWFKGILAARFNTFWRKEPPHGDNGQVNEWFCSHIIEHLLRELNCPTTDLGIPDHGVWPGSLRRSIATHYLGSVTIPKGD